MIFSTSIGTVIAQNSNKKSAEEKSQVLTNKMKTFYGLTDAQTTSVSSINLKFIKDDDALKSTYKNSASVLTTKRNELQAKYDTDILAVLNTTQQDKYKQEVVKRNAKQQQKNKSK
jgi:hypothetical protein